MNKLKIAVLWHQHQPYYKKGDEFILPWVRFHGIKDYYDLAALLFEFPNIRQTFNIVPSMILQVNEYLSGDCSDKIQRLTRLRAEELTFDQKKVILESFFICNVENLILPYPRYRYLYESAQNTEWALNNFSVNDWLDLQVWYNLCWFGQISRMMPRIAALFIKGSQFSEEDKMELLELNDEILKLIVPTLRQLKERNQIEISCSPMYHPILPLLISLNAMKEAVPDAELPEPVFSYPEDAYEQTRMGMEYFNDCFGFRSEGMWSSEGSLSDGTMSMFIDQGISWVAGDEMLLAKTLGNGYDPAFKYFPLKYKNEKGEIAVFFRDHNLSDAIGFTYSVWNSTDAVNNYMERLRSIRNELSGKYGSEILGKAVVPIILDGENCWEFFKDNGIHFLRELYSRLSQSDEFETITFTEALEAGSPSFLPVLNHISAGSWINADFRIWLGHREHIEAWEMLRLARETVDNCKNELSADLRNKIMNEVYIAEGSDWFWWYGDSHFAPNKYDFDDLFRWHIAEIYRLCGREVPENVLTPINESRKNTLITKPDYDFEANETNIFNGRINWEKSGRINIQGAMSTMHQIGEILKEIRYNKIADKLFLCLMPINGFEEGSTIKIIFPELGGSLVIRLNKGFEIFNDKENSISLLSFRQGDSIELSFHFSENEFEKYNSIIIKTIQNENELVFPRQGTIKLLW